MFRAFYNRSYRIYWFGNFISQLGNWVQMLARPWLVYQITGSAASLGFIAFLNAIPLLFLSLLGGVLADRSDRKRLLLVTQALYMLLAFVLAGLVWAGAVEIWHIAVLSLLGGVITSFDLPARQAMVNDMVSRDDLMNAIALNSAGFNTARILGPALAGFLVDQVGMASCFLINGLSFVAVILSLLAIRFEQRPPERKGNVGESIMEGLSYIRSQPRLLTLMSIVSVSSLFAIPYITLMPAVAKEVFGTDAGGMGTLLAANGFGALAGALLLARMSSGANRFSVVSVAGVSLGAALIAFSFTHSFHAAALCLAWVGISAVTQNASTNTLVQLMAPDHLRGRVMSAYMMIFQGIMPFGNLQAGFVAEHWGPSLTVRLGGGIALLYAAFAALWLRRMSDAPLPPVPSEPLHTQSLPEVKCGEKSP